MQIMITGKQIDIGESLRGHVQARLEQELAKRFGGRARAQCVFAREAHGFRAECTVHLDSGITLAVSGAAPEIYASFDQAAERLVKRVQRYKGRLQKHHDRAELKAADVATAAYAVLRPLPDEAEDEAAGGSSVPEPADDAPVVIAETATQLRTLTVGEAVLQLELAEAPALLFRNRAHGGLNLVYRRADGNIGWIDPAVGPADGRAHGRL